MGIGLDFKVTNRKKVAQVARQLSDGETYRGYIKAVIERSLQDLTDYARRITHKDSGTLASGHIWEYDSRTMKGRIFIAPWAIKVQGYSTLQWANVYGTFEEARGGKHAFYNRTLKERSSVVIVRELNGQVKEFGF